MEFASHKQNDAHPCNTFNSFFHSAYVHLFFCLVMSVCLWEFITNERENVLQFVTYSYLSVVTTCTVVCQKLCIRCDSQLEDGLDLYPGSLEPRPSTPGGLASYPDPSHPKGPGYKAKGRPPHSHLRNSPIIKIIFQKDTTTVKVHV